MTPMDPTVILFGDTQLCPIVVIWYLLFYG